MPITEAKPVVGINTTEFSNVPLAIVMVGFKAVSAAVSLITPVNIGLPVWSSTLEILDKFN